MIYDFNQPGHYEAVKEKAKLKAQKKPVAHGFFMLSEMTHFVTGSGTQTGHPGDYVIVGKDHAWPVSKSYFLENYEVVPLAEEVKK